MNSITSNVAASQAHLWEQRTWTNAQIFRNEILNFINGASTRAVGGPPDPDLFNTAADGVSQTWVYIMHPCYDEGAPCPERSSDRQPRYEVRINMMIDAIQNRIPGLARDHIITYYYRPDRTKELLGCTEAYQCRALFQFDPAGIDGGDGRPDWRLMYEGAVITGRPMMGDLDVSS